MRDVLLYAAVRELLAQSKLSASIRLVLLYDLLSETLADVCDEEGVYHANKTRREIVAELQADAVLAH